MSRRIIHRRIQGKEVEDDWNCLSVETIALPAAEARRGVGTTLPLLMVSSSSSRPVQSRLSRTGSSTSEVGGTPCVIPEHYPMSPRSSPRTAADFTESPPAPVTPRRAASKVTREANLLSRSEQAVSTPTLEKVEEDEFASWEMVSNSPASAARRFAEKHPRTAQNLLRAWFALLVLGELGTTLSWLYSLDFTLEYLFSWVFVKSLFVVCGLVGLSFLVIASLVGPQPTVTTAAAIIVAAFPALPAYTAVLLMAIPGDSQQEFESSWDRIQVPMLIVLGMNYLASALVPAVRAERSVALTVLRSLETAQSLTRSAFILSAWLYGAIILHVASRRLLMWGQCSEQQTSWYYWGGPLADPLSNRHGWVLSLHTVGLVCAELLRHTISELGQDLLPRLLGDQRAKALTSACWNLIKRVKQLREYAPPPMVTALVLAVRRTAIIIFLVLAILAILGTSSPAVSLLLGLVLLVVLALVALNERRCLSGLDDLQRLTLLLPSGIAPCSRKLLGYALVAAESVQRGCTGISALGILFGLASD